MFTESRWTFEKNSFSLLRRSCVDQKWNLIFTPRFDRYLSWFILAANFSYAFDSRAQVCVRFDPKRQQEEYSKHGFYFIEFASLRPTSGQRERKVKKSWDWEQTIFAQWTALNAELSRLEIVNTAACFITSGATAVTHVQRQRSYHMARYAPNWLCDRNVQKAGE